MKVIIHDKKYVPTLGKGPFLKPIDISDQLFRTLKLAGFHISRYKEEIRIVNKKTIEKTKTEVETDVEETEVEETEVETDVEETEVETDVEETEVETEVETDVEETEVEETEVETDVEETEVETDVDTRKKELDELTKKELKDILDEMNVDYKYNDNKSELIDLIIENE